MQINIFDVILSRQNKSMCVFDIRSMCKLFIELSWLWLPDRRTAQFCQTQISVSIQYFSRNKSPSIAVKVQNLVYYLLSHAHWGQHKV